jgi:hypothetical protein
LVWSDSQGAGFLAVHRALCKVVSLEDDKSQYAAYHATVGQQYSSFDI